MTTVILPKTNATTKAIKLNLKNDKSIINLKVADEQLPSYSSNLSHI